jgi:hypothetical protein
MFHSHPVPDLAAQPERAAEAHSQESGHMGVEVTPGGADRAEAVIRRGAKGAKKPKPPNDLAQQT